MTHKPVGEIFFEGLVDRVPEFAAVRDEFVRTFGEVIPHPLMGDLGRFVAERVQDLRIVDAVLGHLEEWMSFQDEYIVELISVSFLEGMDPSEPTYNVLKSRMGPLLLTELAKSRGLWE
jgi:hypothetical protein